MSADLPRCTRCGKACSFDPNVRHVCHETYPEPVASAGAARYDRSYAVKVPYAELLETPDRRTMRARVREHLQAVGDRVMQDWENLHPEAEESE